MTDWNCAFTEERLSDYLDGMLSPAEAAAFSAHASGCEACGALVAQVGGLVHQMRALEPVEVPPQLISKILDRTLGPRTQGEGVRRWFAWVPQLWQPRFAMGVATVAATVLIVLYTTGWSPAKLKKTDLSPANVFRTANRQVHLTYARSAKFVNDLRVVYEIQTRLQPDAEPSPSSIPPAPAPQQNPQPHSVNPQEKSQTAPHHGQARNRAMLAFLLNGNWAENFGAAMIGDVTREPSMNCAVHTDVPATGYCRNCGKAMCPQCTREVRGALYCEDCLAGLVAPAAAPEGAKPEVNPGLAATLGVIPGLGAVYNGQYLKALIHVLIFGGLVAALSSDLPDAYNAFLAIALGCFYFYMPIEAYRTAKARRTGEPEPLNLIAGTDRKPIGAFILIGIGALLLLANFGILQRDWFKNAWPLALIAVGGWLLWDRLQKHS